MNMGHKLKITNEIEIDTSLNYQGYLWFSDSDSPIVFDGLSAMNKHQKFSEINFLPAANPFIIEGFLYENKQSYSIKYVDGKYFANQFTVTDDELNDSKQYIAHRMSMVDKLKFFQRWQAVKDEYCAGMEVLVPAELIFTGLILKNKQK
jgi:CRISPR type III-associated protein (TIGR04423 family)